jgi:hypothetical protein
MKDYGLRIKKQEVILMVELKEMNSLELQTTEGGLSWWASYLIGQAINGVIQAATGKSIGGHVSDAITYAAKNAGTRDDGPSSAGYVSPTWGTVK